MEIEEAVRAALEGLAGLVPRGARLFAPNRTIVDARATVWLRRTCQ
jgi:hypothetical protein